MTNPIFELGDLVTVRKGKKAVEVSEGPSEGFLRYIQIEDLRNNVSMKYARNPKGPICDENDVLIAWDGSKAGTVGFGLSGLVGSTIAILRPNDSVYAPYLGMVLQSKYQMIRDACTGATIPHVSKSFLLRMKISLPSISEQKRIAAILDKADEIMKASEKFNDARNNTIRSIYAEMFGDPTQISKYKRVAIGEIVDSIDSGKSPVCSKQIAQQDEWGILKLGSVSFGEYDMNQNKAILDEVHINPKLEVNQGDLLFSRKNTHELVGRVVYVFSTRPKLMLPDLIFRLNAEEKEYSRVYLWATMAHPNMQTEISRLASGSSGSMPNISKNRLMRLEVPIPSINEQRKFETIVRAINKLSENSNSAKVTASSLTLSVQAAMM